MSEVNMTKTYLAGNRLVVRMERLMNEGHTATYAAKVVAAEDGTRHRSVLNRFRKQLLGGA